MTTKKTFNSKHFKCPYCKEQFFIKHKNRKMGNWVNSMPPRFCPECGKYMVVE